MKTTIENDAEIKIIRTRQTRDVVHFIKAWRLHVGMTVDALGARAGMTGSFISQLERGKTTYTQTSLEKVAHALGVQPWRLLASGPDGGEDLWYRAMGRHLEDAIPENRRAEAVALFRQMTSNSWEANVKNLRTIYGRRPREEEPESAGF